MFPIDRCAKKPPHTQWECFVLRSAVQSKCNTNKSVWEEFWPLPEPTFPLSAVALANGKQVATQGSPLLHSSSDSPFTCSLSLKQWSHPLTRNPLIVLNTFHSCGLKSLFPHPKKKKKNVRVGKKMTLAGSSVSSMPETQFIQALSRHCLKLLLSHTAVQYEVMEKKERGKESWAWLKI